MSTVILNFYKFIFYPFTCESYLNLVSYSHVVYYLYFFTFIDIFLQKFCRFMSVGK